ncbi:MAG: AraC family transcriptional regulator [Lachnospiraceae bacterium]|nr:AraC family transcriptional regulator [Lachnospiraceae bacterium]
METYIPGKNIKGQSGTVYEKVEHDGVIPVKVLRFDLTDEMVAVPISKHWHRSLEIIYPKNGRSHIINNGTDVILNEGGLCIINSGNTHEILGDIKQKEYHGFAFQIPYGFLSENIMDFDCCFFDEFILKPDEKLIALLNDLADMYENRNGYNVLMIKSVLYEILYILVRDHSVKRIKDDRMTKSQRKHLLEAINFLDDNSDVIESVHETSAHCGLSYGYIANLFTEYMGISMSEYLNQIRVEKAEEDLIYSEKSITSIAQDRGFKNTKSFYREFGKSHEESPKEYRKKYMRK